MNRGEVCKRLYDKTVNQSRAELTYQRQFSVGRINDRSNYVNEIEKAIFVHKNKLVIMNLIKHEGYPKAIITNLGRILDLQCTGNSSYWREIITCDFLELTEDDFSEMNKTKSSVDTESALQNVKLNSIIWFINFHPPNEKWIH